MYNKCGKNPKTNTDIIRMKMRHFIQEEWLNALQNDFAAECLGFTDTGIT